jgi:hypothetical protein
MDISDPLSLKKPNPYQMLSFYLNEIYNEVITFKKTGSIIDIADPLSQTLNPVCSPERGDFG